MAINPTYPGVYIQEIPSGVRTIRGVATSTAAFIGTFRRGLLDRAVRVQSLSDFERDYGGLDRNSEVSYAVQQFFLNGGTEAWIVRIGSADLAPAQFTSDGVFVVTAGRQIRGETASNPGNWGNNLRVEITHNSAAADTTFNIVVKEVAIHGNRTVVVAEEVFRNLTMAPNRANTAVDVVNAGSRLVQLEVVEGVTPTAQTLPPATGLMGAAGDVELATLVAIDNLSVSLGPAFDDLEPVALDLGVTEETTPASLAAWAGHLQERLRRVASHEELPVALRPYFSGATVTRLGGGPNDAPWRLHVRAGQGAQPFDPTARLVFTGAGATTLGLEDADLHNDQQFVLTGGDDGSVVDAAGTGYLVPAEAFTGNPLARTGLFALDEVDLFNILVIADAPRLGADPAFAVYSEALAYVTERRAMLIVDIPDATARIDQMEAWLTTNAGLRAPNSAVYFPRVLIPDPLNENRPRAFAASGTIAGLWARTDAQRDVWKAPAGTDARLRRVQSPVYVMTNAENGVLNPLGVNCLRTFPVYGSVCWGARTLDGADQIASDWKYLPVRRFTLFLEESLYRGTKWIVFEPNDEPLWAQIRLNIGAFMHDLFRKGAFQGAMPSDAYFVKCDGETTTQTDIDNGIVNIELGFAPLKPAEFVIIKIQQIARRAES